MPAKVEVHDTYMNKLSNQIDAGIAKIHGNDCDKSNNEAGVQVVAPSN